jgi:sugar-specific transcriptional regulator TrmB
MNLETSLQQFGLSTKEAKVYLSTLELGKETVLNIAKKSTLKRPTVYLVLESLIDKGLVSNIPKGNSTQYVAEDPDNLLVALKERQKAIERILPELNSIHNIKEGKPHIRFYEGKRNIEHIWLNNIFTNNRVDFITSISRLNGEYPELLPDFNNISNKNPEFKTRELVTRRPEDIEYANKFHTQRRQIRILPEYFDYSMDIDITNNSVFLVSLENNFSVLMESKDVFKSFQSFYELAWLSAEKV